MNIRVGRRTISVSNTDRVVFPEPGVTKGELIEHYRAVAPVMLPHVRDRPLMLQRVHGSVAAGAFYQKEAGHHFPDWIGRVRVAKEGGSVNHAFCREAACLVYLANQNCITPHPWLSRADDPYRPDRLIFDLDPGPGGAEDARFAAGIAREVLSAAGLEPFLMATGSRGFHVLVPIKRDGTFEQLRPVAYGLALAMAQRAPERLTIEHRKERRNGRLFLDYLRNTYAQTAVPAYALRVRPRATVAVPLNWEELHSAQPDGWDVRTVAERLATVGDPWGGMARRARSLAAARRWLAGHDVS